MVILLIERRLLERLGSSRTEDNESVEENETVLDPEIGIEVDECLKHSDYTRVSLAFSCCFGIIYIVLGVRSLI